VSRLFKIKQLGIFCVFALLFPRAALSEEGYARLDLSRLVVVGDSLSAGVQNFSLVRDRQPNGYANIFANQAGVPLILPLIAQPGAPSDLKLVSLGPPPVIEPVCPSPAATPCPPPHRENPEQQPTNVAVPGVTVTQALTLRPSLVPTADPVQGWATLVLGFPSLLLGQAPPTQIELAQSLNPTTIIEWLGNNDALVPALIGQLDLLTPIDQFCKSYAAVLDALSETGATIITANIPDVTEAAFFESAQTIAQKAGLPIEIVTAELGIEPGDYVRITGIGLVHAILTGQQSGTLEDRSCPPPTPTLGQDVPCVLKDADAARIRSTISCYNDIIYYEAKRHGALLVDIHSLVDRIYTNGYKVKSHNLTTDFLNGLFSLDGVHPSRAGYAIIANEFIDKMNEVFGTNIPEADIAAISKSDENDLYFPGKPGRHPHNNHAANPPAACGLAITVP
jgi:hypothetical protein